MSLQVTIQGVEGCFHDAAAREYFSNRNPEMKVEPIPCPTFPNMFERLDSDPSLVGILAIENTIAGSLLQNHELLRKSQLTIVGEHKMRISHVLACMPDQTIDDISEVRSHPMALMQCERFLHQHPEIRMTETFDTAGSAKEIAEQNIRGVAAICGKYAAELYGLSILKEGIETNRRNFTRFLILADPLSAPLFRDDEKNLDKASIVFTLPHTQGALSKVLSILSFYDMNLSKIQSMPIIGREWEYRFYVDLTYPSYARYLKAIDAVRPLISDFKTLGEYKECRNEI